MTKKSWVSAAEFLAELQRDPAYLEQERLRERERNAKEARHRELMAPVLADLDRIGVHVNRIEDLAPQYAPLSAAIIQVLLRWIDTSTEDEVLEPLVRNLAATTVPYDGRPLVKAFERTSSEALRWAIANTLATTTPTGVTSWVRKASLEKSYGRARELLPVALVRLVPPEEANPVLLSLFEEFPVTVSEGLALSGGMRELEFLKSQASNAKGPVKKVIAKAMRSIGKRLAGADA